MKFAKMLMSAVHLFLFAIERGGLDLIWLLPHG